MFPGLGQYYIRFPHTVSQRTAGGERDNYICGKHISLDDLSVDDLPVDDLDRDLFPRGADVCHKFLARISTDCSAI